MSKAMYEAAQQAGAAGGAGPDMGAAPGFDSAKSPDDDAIDAEFEVNK
jgi:hypothetical protein